MTTTASDQIDPGAPSARDDVRAGLTSRSFLALLVTQFLGALNDNMFRWLVVPIGTYAFGQRGEAAALAAGLACFVLPYIVLAAPAGYLADRFDKRSVIVGCKAAEMVIMLLGVAAIWFGNVYLLFVVVAMMGSQSALFGPAKLGCIPEYLRPEKISSGNGLIGLSTVIAVVVGTIAGMGLYGLSGPLGQSRLWAAALALLGVAVAGWFTSLLMLPLVPADLSRRFPVNLFRETAREVGFLMRRRALMRVALGSAFFWSLGSLAQMNINLFGLRDLNLAQPEIGPLLGLLSLGVGAGSVLAGVLSGGRVELGLVPIGAAGIAVSSILLFAVPDPNHASTAAYVWTCVWLVTLGISAGLFDVPLQAYLQHRSPDANRGSVLAAANFLTFSGMLFTAGAFWVMREPAQMTARQIFLVSGLLTILVGAYAFSALPQATLRMIVWLASHTIYRVRVRGRENLPERGGALLVANHVSWLDGVLLLMASSRPIRMVVDTTWTTGWWTGGLVRLVGAIPIQPGPKAIRKALDTARKALQAGELVCIFPEGGMTRSGQLQGFKRGLMHIQQDAGAAVIPVYLDELWGSIFSFRGGRFFWKAPHRWPYPVSIWFGKPIDRPENAYRVRQAVQDLGAEAVQQRTARNPIPAAQMLHVCRKARFRTKVLDTTGASLSGSALLARTLVLRRALRREVLADEEKYVGVLLPSCVAGVVVNAALAMDRRVSANLNYTVSSDVLNACIAQAGIRHVLTSRKMAEKLKLDIKAQVVYLEDLRDRITTADKLIGALCAYAMPVFLLKRLLGLGKVRGDDPLTVIFTSGSTGQPKGVLLSQDNVASNVEAIDDVVQLSRDDVIAGILPFFHSFGFTVTLWSVLGLDIQGVYHLTPLEPKQVGKLCREHRATVLLATPTFLRSYLKRCPAEDFASLEVVVVGAEKMPVELAAAFEEKFGVRPVEGYGATELSPLVSVNVPPSRARGGDVERKEGSVGRPVPGVSVKTASPETYEDLPPGAAGMLMVKGPNVMLGYLDQPEQTAEVIRDGWYVTGDIAQIDEDGFITITGRLNRFSKIGGEMVPHVRIEEVMREIVGDGGEELQAVVTSVPDARKGERLVVLYTELPRTPEEICKKMAGAGLPQLWIPSPECFRKVEEIPVLGSGKLDLKNVQRLALEMFPSPNGG
ncbi:MAG: acyl-[ACP]--phospholipid O-acyltransferase [Pirellulales bacterium]